MVRGLRLRPQRKPSPALLLDRRGEPTWEPVLGSEKRSCREESTYGGKSGIGPGPGWHGSVG